STTRTKSFANTRWCCGSLSTGIAFGSIVRACCAANDVTAANTAIGTRARIEISSQENRGAHTLIPELQGIRVCAPDFPVNKKGGPNVRDCRTVLNCCLTAGSGE